MNIAVNLTPAELALGGMMLPHARMEDWRWTNLRTLIDKPYPPVREDCSRLRRM